MVPVSDVKWVGAEGNYGEPHRGACVVLHREPSKSLLDRLDHGRVIYKLARV